MLNNAHASLQKLRTLIVIISFIAMATVLVFAPQNASAASVISDNGVSGSQERGAVPCQIQSGTYTLNVAGLQRSYIITTPAGSSSSSSLVLSLHGATGSSVVQQNATQFSPLALREGFIVVYPQAVGTPPSTVWDVHNKGKDAAFIENLLTHLHNSGCGSPTTTSMNGFSNGAMLTSRLACLPAVANKITGVALVAGALSPEAGCQVPPTMQVLVIHGTGDTVVPYSGVVTDVLRFIGVEQETPLRDRTAMAKAWAEAKDCPSPGWGKWNQVIEIDYSCYRSSTQSVVYPNTNHVWNGPGTNTSELIWAQLRPLKPCVVTPPSPPNPALGRAITERVEKDIVFRAQFSKTIIERLPCNPTFRASFENALRNEVLYNPNGETARKLTFLISDEIRVEPNGPTAVKIREALRNR